MENLDPFDGLAEFILNVSTTHKKRYSNSEYRQKCIDYQRNLRATRTKEKTDNEHIIYRFVGYSGQCNECGNTFRLDRNGIFRKQRYCSIACVTMYRKRLSLERFFRGEANCLSEDNYGYSGQCIKCGKIFIIPIGADDLVVRRYCSKLCRNSAEFDVKDYFGQCIICNKSFSLKQNDRLAHRRYCSNSCKTLATVDNRTRAKQEKWIGYMGQCITCGSLMPLNGNISGRRFCSAKCNKLFELSILRIMKKNFLKEDKINKEKMERIGYFGQCTECGKTFELAKNAIKSRRHCSHKCSAAKYYKKNIQLVKQRARQSDKKTNSFDLTRKTLLRAYKNLTKKEETVLDYLDL